MKIALRILFQEGAKRPLLETGLFSADELWNSDKLGRYVAHLERCPAVGTSYSVSQFMGEDGTPLPIYQTPKLDNVCAKDVLCRNPVGNGSAPVIRRAVFESIKSCDCCYGQGKPIQFDPDFRQSEDIECWVRIAATTRWAFAGLSEPLTLYRLNAGGLSASVDRQHARWEAFFAKASVYAPDLIGRSGALARAYRYRYLARRAAWSGDSRTAVRRPARAFASDWCIAIRESARTFVTCGAVSLQGVLPRSVYRSIEHLALSVRAAPIG